MLQAVATQLVRVCCVGLLGASPEAALGSTEPASAPVLKVVKPSVAGTALLRNGGFEQVQNNRAVGWNPAPQGHRLGPGEGRSGSTALVCENPTGQGWFGASQTLRLNRTHRVPVVVRAWSRAENVSGSPDSGYSLYVDIVDADGTPLWGQTGNFRCDSHDWEQREFLIVPDKPIQTLTFHCLFRGHAGTVWFDDLSVEEVPSGEEAVLFEGVLVLAAEVGQQLDQMKALDRVLGGIGKAGFMARDVAAGSDYFAFQPGACPELGLRLENEFSAGEHHVTVTGRLRDTAGGDRAVTLAFALAVDATG